MSLLDNLPHQCTIFTETFAEGTLGGNKATRVDEQTEVECWEQQLSSADLKLYDKQTMRINRKVYFKVDPSVTEQHRIVITSRNRGKTTISTASQRVLEVRSEALPDAGAGLGAPYRVFVEEIAATSQ